MRFRQGLYLNIGFVEMLLATHFLYFLWGYSRATLASDHRQVAFELNKKLEAKVDFLRKDGPAEGVPGFPLIRILRG